MTTFKVSTANTPTAWAVACSERHAVSPAGASHGGATDTRPG
jgi:hypothetical protein